jgi:hypothetical protein
VDNTTDHGSGYSISGTEDDYIYQTVRYGFDGYRFDVENGIYTIILHFAETDRTGAGERIFDVSIEGQLVLDDLDIYAEAGNSTALTKTISDVIVQDGQIDVTVTGSIEQPMINGIEIYFPSGNVPPVLDIVGDQSVDENELVEFTISAADPNGDNLSYSANLSSLPTGASFNATTRAFSWIPAVGEAGTYSDVRFEVSDGDLTDSENITITVNPASYNPTILDPIGDKVGKEGESLEFTISATGSDGNRLTERTMPIIIAYELTSASKQMDELVSDSYILGSGYSMDLRNEPPITGKTVSMEWYNATTGESLDVRGIVTGIEEFVTALGIGEENAEALGNLMLIWTIGESAMTKVGSIEYEPVPQIDVHDKINKILDWGLDAVSIGSAVAFEVLIRMSAYKDAISTLKCYSGILKSLDSNKLARVFHRVGAKLARSSGLAAEAISSGLKVGKFASFFSKLSTFAQWAGPIADVALGVILLFVVAGSHGWTSEYGWTLGSYYAILYTTFGLVLFGIGYALTCWVDPTGITAAIVTLLVVGIDALLSWAFDISWVNEIIEEITRREVCPRLDVEWSRNRARIIDGDKNGLDVGDNITFYHEWYERVRPASTSTTYCTTDDIWKSAITLTFRAVVPSGTAEVFSDSDREPHLRYPTAKLDHAWSQISVVPNVGMINLPVQLILTSLYGIAYYDVVWCWWHERWEEEWEYYRDAEDDVTVLYFDVLPGNLEDFTNWKQITALDHDRDGLPNTEEAIFGSDPYLVDSDTDGLSDQFEKLISTNPRDPDSDCDNLSDGYEVMSIGTDPNSEDSDSDNLTDFEESRGWFIAFNYGNHQEPFVAHVWSDPHINDTDGDGLSDKEEYELGFNPASKDTDGDGLSDNDTSEIALALDINTILQGDLDGDGLIGQMEVDGWDVTYTDTTGNHTIHVTSDPFLADTDVDGLSDGEEFDCAFAFFIPFRTNPRDSDTDNDGLTDIDEAWGAYGPYGAATYPDHFDSDGDGLSDFLEFSFGGDPRNPDTDGDGLSDFEEFNLNSDLDNRDTDYDGLTDYFEERDFGTDLLIPDSDTDGLMDGEEYNLGTDPWNPDSDGDSLSDGYEVGIGTDPLDEDTDGEGLKDGEELQLRTDPLVTDSDGDGLTDFEEIEYGTSPNTRDTDHDGTTDDLDADTYASFDHTVIVLYDELDAGTLQFIEGLRQYTTVESGNWSSLPVDNITGERYLPEGYIVMIGEPVEDENQPVGYWMDYWIEKFLGAEHLQKMLESDNYRFAWISQLVAGAPAGPPAPRPDNQVIIMLTRPYETDHWRTLSMLKYLKVEVTENQMETSYPGTQDSFVFNATDRVDFSCDVALSENISSASMVVTRYNWETTPHPLTWERYRSVNT